MTTQAGEARLAQIAPGLFRFDTHYLRPGHTACFVVVENGRAAIVDCATAAAVEPLLATIEDLGVAREAVDAVIATHAHLDHSGGIGRLLAALPQARLYAHRRTAPHLIDPAKLEQGTRTVLGDELVEREHEPLLPVPAERVVETPNGATVPPAGRDLRVVHTPGHARDHQSLWDERTATVLAGDAFGVGYPELIGVDGPFVVPETPPTQFDPEAMHASIDRIMALDPARVAPSHFEVLDQPATIAAELHAMVDEGIARCLDADSVEALEAGVLEAYEQALQRRGRGEDIPIMHRLYGLDAHLVAQGLWHWRRRQGH